MEKSHESIILTDINLKQITFVNRKCISEFQIRSYGEMLEILRNGYIKVLKSYSLLKQKYDHYHSHHNFIIILIFLLPFSNYLFLPNIKRTTTEKIKISKETSKTTATKPFNITSKPKAWASSHPRILTGSRTINQSQA